MMDVFQFLGPVCQTISFGRVNMDDPPFNTDPQIVYGLQVKVTFTQFEEEVLFLEHFQYFMHNLLVQGCIV